MSQNTAIDFLEAETHRLETLGVIWRGNAEIRIESQSKRVDKEAAQPLHPHPRAGRKRLYASDYDRLKAHRRKKSRMITK